MTSLENIIAAGVAAYQASLPDYARGPLADVEPTEAQPIITLTEAEQARVCLSCSLADCVDVTDSRCPIRIEQRRVWRRNRQEARR